MRRAGITVADRRHRSAPDRTSSRASGHDALVALLVATTMLCAFVPFDFAMPDIGLDPSWRLAVNEAVTRGFVFGSRIVFTYGPYASVFTGAWHPGTAGLMLAGGAWLAVAGAIALRAIAPRGAVAGPLALCLLLAFLSTSRDTLLLSIPMFATIATPVFAVRVEDRDRRVRWHVAAAIVYAAAGLLVLVKGNLVVACALSTLLNGLFLVHARRPFLALVAIGMPAVSALACWSLAGQPPAALLPYLSATLSIARGYSDAMALFGEDRTIVEYLVGAAMLVGAILLRRRPPVATRVFLAASLVLYLFVVFKTAFVRQDGEHALIASGFLLLASVALLAASRSRTIAIATAASLALWVVAELRHDPLFPTTVAMRITAPFESAVAAVEHRWSDARWPRSAYDEALARIAAARPLPVLDGTTDIYSHAQSLVIASGAAWSPRPVFQSYAAYDAHLASINADVLVRPERPRNVLFAVEPIDRRLPALEDGASWPALLDGYRAIAFAGGLLQLERRDAPAASRWTVIERSRRAVGEAVPLPVSIDPVYVGLDVRPTWAGRLRSAAYKTRALLIEVELADGSKRTFLLPPSMAAAPFLLSPLVEDTRDFERLFVPAAAGKRVRSFRLLRIRDGDDDWEASYVVTFGRRTTTAP